METVRVISSDGDLIVRLTPWSLSCISLNRLDLLISDWVTSSVSSSSWLTLKYCRPSPPSHCVLLICQIKTRTCLTHLSASSFNLLLKKRNYNKKRRKKEGRGKRKGKEICCYLLRKKTPLFRDAKKNLLSLNLVSNRSNNNNINLWTFIAQFPQRNDQMQITLVKRKNDPSINLAIYDMITKTNTNLHPIN